MKILLVSLIGLLAVTTTVVPVANARSDSAKSIPKLFRRVSPSVVFIAAVTINPFKLNDRVSSSIGSGCIISADGLILTNSHVIFGSQAIAVTLDDGSTTSAELLGADPILDLAVIRIPTPTKGLPTATLGDSDTIRVGEEVVAIGNPVGLEQTITRGVVSGINRILPTSPMSLTLPLIQTDAAINPGSSGGPLLNRHGEVIGITTSILAEAENIGFAVPINIAKCVLPQLVNEGRVIRPWLGVHGKLINSEDLRAVFNLPLVDGFLVETVDPGSPASKAGLRGGELPITIVGLEFLFWGDIITAVNGDPLKDPERFAKFVHSLKVGDKVRLTISRHGEQHDVEFYLPERPILPGDLPLPPCGRRVLLPMSNLYTAPSTKPFTKMQIFRPNKSLHGGETQDVHSDQ